MTGGKALGVVHPCCSGFPSTLLFGSFPQSSSPRCRGHSEMSSTFARISAASGKTWRSFCVFGQLGVALSSGLSHIP